VDTTPKPPRPHFTLLLLSSAQRGPRSNNKQHSNESAAAPQALAVFFFPSSIHHMLDLVHPSEDARLCLLMMQVVG